MDYDFSRALETLGNRKTTKKVGTFCPRDRCELEKKGGCLVCPKCGYEKRIYVNYDLEITENILTTITMGNWKNCAYCGDLPDSRDHIIPYSMFSSDRTNGDKSGPKVIACLDCNDRLHDKYFSSFTARAHEAQRRIRNKNLSLLRTQTWDERELLEMDYNLSSYIRARINLRNAVERRLDWQDSPDYIRLRQKMILQVSETCPENEWLRKFMSLD